MSYKNKDKDNLPRVFSRLGSSSSSTSKRNMKQPKEYKLPDYSAISRMDSDVLHYASPIKQQQQQVISHPLPVQNVFNFVKNGQIQEQSISFVNPITTNNNNNNNQTRSISFMKHSQPYQQQQQWNNSFTGQEDNHNNSDSDTSIISSSSSINNDKVPTRQVIYKTSNRNRSTSPIKRSNSPPHRRNIKHSHTRRPRRRPPRNHDASDEELAPFLKGQADHYTPSYYTDDSSDSNDESDDINTRLSTQQKDIVEKPHKTSAASILASGPLPPSKKFTKSTSTKNTTNSSSSAAIHAKKPVTPISHKIITASNTIVPPKSVKLPTSTINNDNKVKNITAPKKTTSPPTSTTAKMKTTTTDTTSPTITNNNETAKINKSPTVAPTISATAVKNDSLVKSSNDKPVKKADNLLLSDNISTQPKNSPTTTTTTNEIKPKKEQDSKELLRKLHIDDRDDVVMDITTYNNNPQEKLLKQEPDINQTDDDIKKVFQQTWESITQVTATQNNDENSSISASSTTTNSINENDPMDIEYNNSKSPSPIDLNTQNTTNQNNASTKRKKSRVSSVWKVRMAGDGEITYLNTVTGEITTARPVSS